MANDENPRQEVPSIAHLRVATQEELRARGLQSYMTDDLTEEEAERLEEGLKAGPPDWVKERAALAAGRG